MKLSEQIKEYRKKHEMSQTEFAEKLYVSKQTISKWENNKGLPDITIYPKLAQILDVSIDELMQGETKKVETSCKKGLSKKIKILIIIMSIILGIITSVFLCFLLFAFLFNIINFFKIYSYIKEVFPFFN